jgi:hypothetical protein
MKILRSATDTKILVMALRFSGTSPQYLPGWSNDQLPPSHMSCAWKGAQLVFGSLWIQTVQSPAPALQLPTTLAVPGQSASVSLTSQSQTSMSPTDQSESTAQASISHPLWKNPLVLLLLAPQPVPPLQTTPPGFANDCFTRSKPAPIPTAKRLKKLQRPRLT